MATGNVTLINVLAQPFQWGASTTSIVTSVFIVLSIAILSAVVRRPSSDPKIHKLQGFDFLTAWSFFSKQYDFLRNNFEKTGLKMFSFQVLEHRVIAMSGEENRKIMFNDPGLDMTQGYLILRGGIPKLQDVSKADAHRDSTGTELNKRLIFIFRKERVTEVLPLLLQDVNRMMKDWDSKGTMDPFKEFNDLVFQLTVRIATCKELAEDKQVISRLAQHYWDIEQSATPASALFPWFPTPAKRLKQRATMALYTTILSYVNVRRKASTPSISPIDLFISQGTSDDVIVGTIMNIIFAGVVNTAANSCWALLHLATHPTWKRRAIDEYNALVEKYSDSTPSDPLLTRLLAIPLDAWEDELPSLDLVLRESLRISVSPTILRRNIGRDIQAGEATIKRGDFLAYSVADANLNPDIYSNPLKFDPDRYGPGREEDRKEAMGYLAFGAGRHPCPGMKMAKLEIKVILAMMLLGYEYEIVDGNGNPRKTVPDQNRNDIHQSRPLGGDACYLKYKRVVE